MPVSWSLQGANGNGLLQSFQQWGIRSAVRVSVNQGVGTLTLGFGAHDIFAASPFEPGESLLVLRDGVPWFRGRVTGEKRGAYGSREGLRVILSDPWWYLEKIIYTEAAQFVDDPNANPAPGDGSGVLQASDFDIVTKPTSEIILGRVESREQIIQALNYAKAHGAPLDTGTIDDGINVPLDRVRDVTCAELIRKSLRWTPDQAAFWDYSINPPKLHIRSRANRSPQALDLADAAVSEIELTERRDLALSGVTINYVQRNDRFGTRFATLTQDQAGPDPTGLNALIFTQELQGNYLVQDFAVGGYLVATRIVQGQVIPTGIAAIIYAARAIAPWDGRISLVYDDLPDIPWLSHTLRVLHGFGSWSDAFMDPQQVQEDILDGKVDLTVGPPLQLGPSDLLGLVRQAQTQDVAIFPGPVPPPVPPLVPPANPPPVFSFGSPPPGFNVDVVLNADFNAATNINNPGYGPVSNDTGRVVDGAGNPLSSEYRCTEVANGVARIYAGSLNGTPFTVRFLSKYTFLCPPSPPIPNPNPAGDGSFAVTVVVQEAVDENGNAIVTFSQNRVHV